MSHIIKSSSVFGAFVQCSVAELPHKINTLLKLILIYIIYMRTFTDSDIVFMLSGALFVKQLQVHIMVCKTDNSTLCLCSHSLKFQLYFFCHKLSSNTYILFSFNKVS